MTGTAGAEIPAQVSLCVIRPLIRVSISLNRRISSSPVAASASRRAQQDVIGLVFAQYVINKIGGEQHLPARFFPRRYKAPRDQSGNHGASCGTCVSSARNPPQAKLRDRRQACPASNSVPRFNRPLRIIDDTSAQSPTQLVHTHSRQSPTAFAARTLHPPSKKHTKRLNAPDALSNG